MDTAEGGFKHWYGMNFEGKGKGLFSWNYHITEFNRSWDWTVRRMTNFDFGMDSFRFARPGCAAPIPPGNLGSDNISA